MKGTERCSQRGRPLAKWMKTVTAGTEKTWDKVKSNRIDRERWIATL